jgi:hypothetical protein
VPVVPVANNKHVRGLCALACAPASVDRQGVAFAPAHSDEIPMCTGSSIANPLYVRATAEAIAALVPAGCGPGKRGSHIDTGASKPAHKAPVNAGRARCVRCGPGMVPPHLSLTRIRHVSVSPLLTPRAAQVRGPHQIKRQEPFCPAAFWNWMHNSFHIVKKIISTRSTNATTTTHSVVTASAPTRRFEFRSNRSSTE